MKKSEFIKLLDQDGAIDLDKLDSSEYVITYDPLGTSNGVWYNFEDFKVYYKESGSDYSYFANILYGRIAKMCGVDYAECFFAKRNNKKGVITFDIAKNSIYVSAKEIISKFMDFRKLNDDSYNKLIELNKQNNLKSMKKYFKKIFRDEEVLDRLNDTLILYFVLDILVCNEDRHTDNWGILIGDDTRVAPSFDNDRILGLRLNKSELEDITDSILQGESKISDYLNDAGFSIFGYENKNSYTTQLLAYYKLANEDKRSQIHKVINNFSIEKAIKETEKLVNHKLPGDVRAFVKAAANRKKEILKNGIRDIIEKENLDKGQLISKR